MIDVVVFVVLAVAVAAPLCGHQGQPWPLAPLWEAVAAAVAASRALRALGEQPERYRPPQRPAWAAA